jgi:hypothetical protein
MEKLTSRFLASVSRFRDGPNDYIAACSVYSRTVCILGPVCRPLVSDTQPSCVAAGLARCTDTFGAVAPGESD